MTKLTDMQLVLLSTAAARADRQGSRGRGRGDRCPPLVAERRRPAALAAEAAVTDAPRSWRSDGDQLFGVIITDAGRAAIGVTEPVPDEPQAPELVPTDKQDGEPTTPVLDAVGPPAEHTPRPASKIATVLDLLRRHGGATLTEMVTATGWLPHTTRAALTGLRKKGRVLDKGARDGATAYTISKAA